jgi:hypothetical protein
MKFVEPSRFTDPDAAARKLVEIANATEAVASTSNGSTVPFSKWADRRTSTALPWRQRSS